MVPIRAARPSAYLEAYKVAPWTPGVAGHDELVQKVLGLDTAAAWLGLDAATAWTLTRIRRAVQGGTQV